MSVRVRVDDARVPGTPTAADRRAARRWGSLVDQIAARYTNPVTGGRLSGAALLLKLASGESLFNSDATSGAGAHGRTQFMPGSRQAILNLTHGKVDPWGSIGDAYHAAALHLLGKVNGKEGLEGYNPGSSSYASYILGQKVGPTGAGGSHGASGGAQAPAAVAPGSTPVSAVSNGVPQAESSAGVQALLAQLGGGSRAPRPSGGLESPAFSAQATLAGGFRPLSAQGAPERSDAVDALLKAAAGSQAAGTTGATALGGHSTLVADSSSAGKPAVPDGAHGSSRGPGKVTVAGGANRAGVGLQRPILGFLKDVSARMGKSIAITTGTNHSRMTTSGNVSDHWDGNAADIGLGGDARQSVEVGRKGDLIAARAIQQASGVSFDKAYAMARRGGVWNFETDRGRVQILWRTLTGGNHYNHVHVGVNPGR